MLVPEYKPMLARSVTAAPLGDQWRFEPKWDGIRAGLFVADGRISLISRRGTEMRDWFPTLHGIGEAVAAKEALVDGEVIAGDGSVESFNVLLRYSRSRGRGRLDLPLTFVAFDILAYEGADTTQWPIEQRRDIVRRAIREGPGMAFSRDFANGHALYEAAIAHGLEGIVGKKRSSLYSSGRSADWIKVKAPDAAERHEWTSR